VKTPRRALALVAPNRGTIFRLLPGIFDIVPLFFSLFPQYPDLKEKP